MSWARWGPDSDVYVFEDVAGGVTCCGCSLSGATLASFNASDPSELVAHFAAHLTQGDLVPLGLCVRLDEYAKGWSP